MTANPKPWVQAACVCEKVLIEPDRVPSLIRIVDTYMLEMPDLPEGTGHAVELTAFVSVKSGDLVGQFDVGIRLVNPDGTTGPDKKWTVELKGNEHGSNLKVDFSLLSPRIGLYWFDVLWTDGELLTRIPFRLKKRQPTQTPTDE